MYKALIVLISVILIILGIWLLAPRPKVTRLLKQGAVVISCWFGTATDIAEAPSTTGVRSIFFTNNPMLTSLISSRGWEVVLTTDKIYARDVSPLDADGRKNNHYEKPGKSSLQSKQIKFLCFPDEHRHILDKYKTIIYMDHKRIVQNIDQLLRLHTSEVLIRFDKKVKSIASEIQVANFQKRYSVSMPSTVRWIEAELQKLRKKPSDIRICNTGVIVYQNTERVLKFTKAIYDNCINLNQPECQLIWATLSQRSDAPAIKIINYMDINTRPLH